MLDIFISHSTQDRNVANATLAILEQRGLRCWMAPRDINPGEEWGDAIIRGLDLCRAMVLVFSQHANESRYVKREVERAVTKGMLVVPFRIEDVQPQGAMALYASSVHWLDAFSPPFQAHLERLADSFDSWLPKSSKINAPPKPTLRSPQDGGGAPKLLTPRHDDKFKENAPPESIPIFTSNDSAASKEDPSEYPPLFDPVVSIDSASTISRSDVDDIMFKGVMDLAITLDDMDLQIYVKDSGIYIREPCVAALSRTSLKVVAVGHQALQRLAISDENLVEIWPVERGAIVNEKVGEIVLREFINKALPRRGFFGRTKMVICVRMGLTIEEVLLIRKIGHRVGASKVHLMDNSLAAGIGSGVFNKNATYLVANIGSSVTDIAVVSGNRVVYGRTLLVGAVDMDTAIARYCDLAYNVNVSRADASNIRYKLGSTYQLDWDASMEVSGMSPIHRSSEVITLTSQEIRDVLIEFTGIIIDGVTATLAQCPSHLEDSLAKQGVVLTGPGAILRGFDRCLAQETAHQVSVPEDPLSAVCEGAGWALCRSQQV